MGSGTAKTVERSRLVVPTPSSKFNGLISLMFLQSEQDLNLPKIYYGCMEAYIISKISYLYPMHLDLAVQWICPLAFQAYLEELMHETKGKCES